MSNCVPCGAIDGAQSQDKAEHSIVNPGRPLKNWGRSYHFKPAIIVEAQKYEDVIAAIKDTDKYPSPVRALGNIHSVTEIVVNEGGTVILMRRLREPLALANDEAGQSITAQAGITLLELHQWLGKTQLEMAVAPEIGDATVGSLVGSVSKDSGVGNSAETGTLYKAILGVKYVDHKGDVIVLTQKQQPEQLAAFKCSEGLLGVVLEVTFRVFPQRLVKIGLDIWDTKKMIKDIHRIITEDRNAFILVQPEQSFVETRQLAPKNAFKSLDLWWSIIAAAKQPNFQHGRVLFPFPLLKLFPYRATCYRRTQVNHYSEPGPKDTALCFSWYEYPMERWEEVVTGFISLILDFASRHDGWRPGACATYFVRRCEGKPHGWFSRKGKGFEHPGVSFTLDPIYKYPADPTWLEFAREANKFAITHGGRVSLTQTREVTRETFLAGEGQEPLKEAPNQRFTTPYLQQFVEDESSRVKDEEAPVEISLKD